MGVMEHLSEYARTLTQFASVMKQGARLYLDFGSQKERHGGSSFITKYIWPGNFRLVYMPELMEAVDRSLLQVAGVYNDRLNYFRWSRDGYLRWMENKKKVVEEVGEEMYRLFLLFFAGTAGVMSNPNQEIGAYRMVLERP
jgi:cyclopropane-fatty-acyl-phospholipid synthase